MSAAGVQAGIAAALVTFAAADVVALAARHGTRRRGLGRLAMHVRRLAPGLVSDERLRLRAAQAGVAAIGADLLALKSGAALGGATLALPAVAVLGIRPAALVLTAVAGLAFMAPDWVLSRRIVKRRARIALELPAALDLLAVTIDAGLPVVAAIDELARRHHGLLGSELRLARAEIAAGSPRADALDGLRRRCPHEGVAALVAAIDRADRHGASLGPALAAIASDARQHRARAIREHAARAAPQIQLVIALGLVPATMLIVAAALLASFG